MNRYICIHPSQTTSQRERPLSGDLLWTASGSLWPIAVINP
jgi:hypothetical protein